MPNKALGALNLKRLIKQYGFEKDADFAKASGVSEGLVSKHLNPEPLKYSLPSIITIAKYAKALSPDSENQGRVFLDILTGFYPELGSMLFDTREYPSLSPVELCFSIGRRKEFLGEWEGARSFYRQAEENAPDRPTRAKAQIAIATQEHTLGNLQVAESIYQSILAEEQGPLEPLTLAQANIRVGHVLNDRGYFKYAEKYLKKGRRLARKYGDPGMEADAIHLLGRNYLERALRSGDREDMETALKLLKKSYRIVEEKLGGIAWIAYHALWKGHAYQELGDYEQARRCREEALWIWKANQDRYREGFVYLAQGKLAASENNYHVADEKLFDALYLFNEVKFAKGVADCLSALAESYAKRGGFKARAIAVSLSFAALLGFPERRSPAVDGALNLLQELKESSEYDRSVRRLAEAAMSGYAPLLPLGALELNLSVDWRKNLLRIKHMHPNLFPRGCLLN